jgi:hypothetical protein
MNALISTSEIVYSYDREPLGSRVAQISETTFPVAPSLFWIPCATDIVVSDVYYNTETGTIEPMPIDPEVLLREVEAAAVQEASTVIEV